MPTANPASSADVANSASPRVAYFPDSFHEVNGVAHTSRHFEAFARRHNLPFLCVRAGDREHALMEEGSVWTLELPRGFLSFALEKDLRFDPAFLRHIPLISETLERFQPDLIHITGPSEIGMLGAGLAHHLELPLAASWHTNVHEYLARRSDWFLRLLPERQSTATAKKIQDLALATAAFFYSGARVLFAPNPELCDELAQRTNRACHLMPRGVDAELFNPLKRSSKAPSGGAVLGFVGRLSVEKNIALLVEIEQELERMGIENFRFLIVGHGGDEAWLRERLRRAEFTGVLRGEELSAAYASMDLFVFPSHTDTFGNVVLEALASGVPAIVTPDGGPRTIVRDHQTGRIVQDEEFAAAIAAILANPAEHAAMRTAARVYALTASWDSVFEGVYAAYEAILPQSQVQLKPLAV
ncbi:MAG TPA: glycosyltransferase [Terracidiphilus sp.]|nr:glycosyltransferase [Terracidiphilus sp.]